MEIASMAKLYRLLQWIAVALSGACLVLILGLVFYMARLSQEEKSWRQIMEEEVKAQQPAPLKKTPDADAPLTAEQKIELQRVVAEARTQLIAEIHAVDADERAILDRLITLVGVFSAILGLCAFATVRLAREDAIAQAKRIDKDLDAFKAAATNDLAAFKNRTIAETMTLQTSTEASLQSAQDSSKLGLEALTRNTSSQIEEFRRNIWSELPEMRNLKDGLRNLLLDLERTIPSESNWNAERAYESLSESERQNILITESTVNALRIFISGYSTANLETQARLYRALARFYLGRFRVEKLEQDAERADIYARRSQEIEPENSDNYRLRGALYLAKYRILKKNPPATPSLIFTEKLASLLSAAEGLLSEATRKNDKDAGAAYNLALATSYRDNFDKAIAISKEAIEKRDELSYQQVRKYLPNLYINLACFLAKKADKEGDATVQASSRENAVTVLQEGLAYFEKRDISLGIQALRIGIQRERQDTGAYKNLTPEQKASLDAML